MWGLGFGAQGILVGRFREGPGNRFRREILYGTPPPQKKGALGRDFLRGVL